MEFYRCSEAFIGSLYRRYEYTFWLCLSTFGYFNTRPLQGLVMSVDVRYVMSTDSMPVKCPISAGYPGHMSTIEFHTINPREESGCSVNVKSKTALTLRWELWVKVEPDCAGSKRACGCANCVFYQENTNCQDCCLQITLFTLKLVAKAGVG